MTPKKSFNVYYLLVSEGTTEFNLFAYLTKNRYRELFDKSAIKFSNKLEITEAGISGGKLNGAGNLPSFRGKFDLIKGDARYAGQKLFFIIDRDLDDSSDIETLIKHGGDIVQLVEPNSEHLLLKFSGKSPKNPTEFNNLLDFRTYCKSEFQKHFGKKASDLKDSDFDVVFSNATDDEIKASFAELFATLD